MRPNIFGNQKKMPPKTAISVPQNTTAPTTKTRYTLEDVLALGKGADPKLRQVLFRNVNEAVLVARGQGIESKNILDDLPTFLFDARTTYAGLTETQKEFVVGYAPALDHVLGAEVEVLSRLYEAHQTQGQAGTITRKKAKAAAGEAWTAAMVLRDQAARTLGRLLGSGAEDQVAVRASKGTAVTEESLAAGLDALASLIEEHRGKDEDLRAAMDVLKLTAAYAERLKAAAVSLRKAAKDVAATAPDARVTQRKLDLQDGTVLHLVEFIYRAFKEARGHDETILLPRLGSSMGRVIDRNRVAAAKSPTGQPGNSQGAGTQAAGAGGSK